MPQPTASQVHIDAPLTNISTAYVQSEANFIGTKVFPIVPVDKKSDKYFTLPKNDWLRDEAQLLADGDTPALSGFSVSNDSYNCDVYAIGKKIGDQVLSNQDAALDVEEASAIWATQRILLRQEIQFQNDAFKSGVWTTDATPGTTWESNSSDPIADIETAKQTILGRTGFTPNTLVLGYAVAKRLRQHADLVDRIKYGGTADNPAVVGERALAQVFGVERVLVAKAIKATNVEGETGVYAFAQTSLDALLCYVNPNPGLMAPSAGYTFAWNGVSQGFGSTIAISKETIPNTFGAMMVAARAGWDNKIVGADLGYFFSGAVAS